MNPDETTAYFCFDPRDTAQRADDRTTWKLSDNAILISATMLYAAHGNKSAMCWDKVAALADLCDDLRNDPEVLPASDAALEKDARNEESGLEQTAAMLRATLARQPTGARVRDGS